MKLIYIANARLPTEKAHGYQIVKMCEAFSELGVEVLLIHPYRHQHYQRLRDKTVFEYYGLGPAFEVLTLPNPDVLLLQPFFPGRTFVGLFFLYGLLWGRYAALTARKEAADLYYTRNVTVAFWLLRLGLSTVLESHTMPKYGQRWLLRRMIGHPKLRLIIPLTSFLKERYAELGFDQGRLAVFPDGVDLSLFNNLPDKAECRRQLSLSVDLPIIGYIGRFQTLGREKGIPQLIESMVHLRSINGKVPLLLCVGGPMNVVQDYLDRADLAGIPRRMLRFVDRVPNSEVPQVMKACDVCTIPWTWTEFSAYYTSPLKLFEYMAAGVPIVASDLPSLKEILRHGENAWLVQPGDPSALAEGIRTVLTDRKRAERLAESARRDVRIHTWKARASHILELIQARKDSQCP